MSEEYFSPGLKDEVYWNKISLREYNIIKNFAKADFYATRLTEIGYGNDQYHTVLFKPSPRIKQMFNIQREILAIISPFDAFQPRSLRMTEMSDIEDLRIEEVCSILISKDKDVENKVRDLLKSNEESRIVVPFSYQELDELDDVNFIVNRIRSHFYSRDLFANQDPLKKDLFFFGRRDIVQTLVNRHLTGNNSGIFGLRKTGKTSILYSVMRTAKKKKSTTVYIDCQDLHNKRWNIALYSTIQQINETVSAKRGKLHSLEDYENTEFCGDYFRDDLTTLYRQSKKPILIVFDEIEHISFITSQSSDWKSGDAFIRFWQTIRSAYNRTKDKVIFTFLIAGTNPSCVEVARIGNTDNPIYLQFPTTYVPPFTFEQTKEMIGKLGGYMGMKFDDVVIGQILDQFGGHPMLMRQICSYFHTQNLSDRPIIVNKASYLSLLPQYLTDEDGFRKFAKMVLDVLEKFYPDEKDLLDILSVGDYETFKEYANDSPGYVKHLINYGIVQKNNDDYAIVIESILNYLKGQNEYKRINLSNDERIREINKRRDSIERAAKTLLKNTLLITFGEDDAKKRLIKEIYGGSRISDFLQVPYEDLFNSSLHNLHFRDIFELIRKNYNPYFKNIFQVKEPEFTAKTTLLNSYRTVEAHAGVVSEADFKAFRGVAEWIEAILKKFT